MPTFVYIDPPPAGSSQTVTRVYVASYSSSTAGTSFTFSSCSLGTAASGRVIGIVVTGARSGTGSIPLSSGSIAGTSGSVAVTTNIQNGVAAVLSRQVDAGTTGDITVTFPYSLACCAIHVFAIYGASSATASDTVSATNSSAQTLTIPAGGVAIGGALTNTQGVSWTVTGLSQDASADLSTTSNYCTGSVESLLGGGTTVRFLPTGSSKVFQAFAAWG